MNGFKHVNCRGVGGGHYWVFDRAKLSRILALTDGDHQRTKRICYRLRNDTWPDDLSQFVKEFR